METTTEVSNEHDGDTRNDGIVAKIALKRGLRLEDVRPLYEKVLSKMESEAIIRDFLSVLAARKVESFLDKKESFPEDLEFDETA